MDNDVKKQNANKLISYIVLTSPDDTSLSENVHSGGTNADLFNYLSD